MEEERQTADDFEKFLRLRYRYNEEGPASLSDDERAWLREYTKEDTE